MARFLKQAGATDEDVARIGHRNADELLGLDETTASTAQHSRNQKRLNTRPPGLKSPRVQSSQRKE
jgi:hypothetical protein